MSASSGKGGGSHRSRWIALGVVAVVLGAAIAGGVYLIDSGGSKAAPKAAAATTIQGHEFFAPECTPVAGTRWVYPGTARITSNQYESFAIHYDCASAAKWTKRLAQLKVAVQHSGAASKIPGPPGFNCEAWADANGHAYAGGCQKGTQVAFGWNWNVENSRQIVAEGQDGLYHIEQLAGADTETILTPRGKNGYQIKVLNTSGIGYLNGFTWTAPPGWKINGITKVTGVGCKLEGQKVVCSGRVVPPKCLCAGDGGVAKIDLAISHTAHGVLGGKPVSYGTVGAKLRITSMTAVPYLIPGTPKEAKRQGGL